MNRTITRILAASVITLALTPGLARASEAAEPPAQAEPEKKPPTEGGGLDAQPMEITPNQQDYRGRVVTAVAFMFTAIIGFVALSARRSAKMREELEHVQRRLQELEKGGQAS